MFRLFFRCLEKLIWIHTRFTITIIFNLTGVTSLLPLHNKLVVWNNFVFFNKLFILINFVVLNRLVLFAFFKLLNLCHKQLIPGAYLLFLIYELPFWIFIYNHIIIAFFLTEAFLMIKAISDCFNLLGISFRTHHLLIYIFLTFEITFGIFSFLWTIKCFLHSLRIDSIRTRRCRLIIIVVL